MGLWLLQPRRGGRARKPTAARSRWPQAARAGAAASVKEKGLMYVIRETFVAKPGMASKLAKLLSETMSATSDFNVRVLTDFVGPFNTVVMETEVENLEEHGRRMKDYMEKSNVRERMKGYTDLYQSGSREIYQVVQVPATLRR
jgi:hypothetical protein